MTDSEKGLSKEYIVELFDKFEKECATEGSGWKEEILAEDDNIKAWSSMKGTHLNSKIPCVRIDWN
jgi:hypothetical protein